MVKDDLLAMGFDPKEVDAALANTNGSIDACIDWISSRQDLPPDTEAAETPQQQQPAVDPSLPVEERLRLRKEAAAKKRAEEEKRQRIDRLEIGKRQAEADRVRQEMQIEQAKKDAAARKREAMEDREYKERLRKKIAQDRMEREAREREQQRLRDGAAASSPIPGLAGTVGSGTTASTTSTGTAAAKPPSAVRMRIKFNAKTLTKSVSPDLTVEDLGEELAPELELAPGSFELETAYPRQTISIVANTKTVVEAGLSNTSLTVKLL